MAVTKVLARSWTKQVDNGSGSFLDIKGIHTMTVSTSSHLADTTDFESAGWLEHLLTTRGATISLDGMFLEDTSTKSRDPGQARVEALAKLFGASGIGSFKIITPGGTIWTFSASAEVDGPAGSQADTASWKCKLNVTGAITVT
jgi:predicted secreted protein